MLFVVAVLKTYGTTRNHSTDDASDSTETAGGVVVSGETNDDGESCDAELLWLLRC